MLYVEIKGERHYIEDRVVKRYSIKEGDKTPYTGFQIKKDKRKNKKR